PDPGPLSCTSRLAPGAARREVTDAHANLPAVVHIYRVPPHADSDTPALELLNVILGEGESSRLNVAVVRRDKAALGTQVAMNPFDSRRGPGVLLVLAIANQGVDPLRLDALVTAQLDSLRAIPVTSDELTKAKNTFRAGFLPAVPGRHASPRARARRDRAPRAARGFGQPGLPRGRHLRPGRQGGTVRAHRRAALQGHRDAHCGADRLDHRGRGRAPVRQ